MRRWALWLAGVAEKLSDVWLQQKITGLRLLTLNMEDITNSGMTSGQAEHVILARDELKSKKEEPASSVNWPQMPFKPYPFDKYHLFDYTYTEGSILGITESGALNYIEPCHEYKAFTNTTDENEMSKFTYEVIRFAAACMNSRTNGTIHFGVGDKPHGQVLGVVVDEKEAFGNKLQHAVNNCFEHKHRLLASQCIRPPRFVVVLNKDRTFSNKYVIEVDIVPDYVICKENVYHTLNMDKKKRKTRAKGAETDRSVPRPRKQFFVRDGSSSRNLLAPTTDAKPSEKYDNYVKSVGQLSQRRKQAEDKESSRRCCDSRCGFISVEISKNLIPERFIYLFILCTCANLCAAFYSCSCLNYSFFFIYCNFLLLFFLSFFQVVESIWERGLRPLQRSHDPGQKNKKSTELLHGHFHIKSLPDGGVDRTIVICNHCKIEFSITGALRV